MQKRIKENKLMESLHSINPYKNFDKSGFKPDLQGWGSNRPIFRRLIDKINPKLIIEVGTWKGGSAINMGKYIKKKKMNCKILCIDTWLGGVEHWIAKDKKSKKRWYSSLSLKNGYPQLYYQFLYNIIANNLQDVIVPFPQTSEAASIWLKLKGIKSDLVYIDGAHDRASVYSDVVNYYSLLNKRGIIFGDDYNDIKYVTKAVNEFVKKKGVILKLVEGNKVWTIQKK